MLGNSSIEAHGPWEDGWWVRVLATQAFGSEFRFHVHVKKPSTARPTLAVPSSKVTKLCASAGVCMCRVCRCGCVQVRCVLVQVHAEARAELWLLRCCPSFTEPAISLA